jgi:carboxyl-terminal processing protease
MKKRKGMKNWKRLTFRSGLVLSVALLGMAFMRSDINKYFEIAKNIEIFTNLYKEINMEYVDEIDPARLMRTGLDAMLESLDPFTNYISESEIEGYRFITEGKYNGIGASFRKMGERITITEPYENSPAVKAGLKAGDVILAIDGRSTEGKSASDVTDIMQGFPGTEVELTIKRPGESKEQKVSLVRGEVKVPNVPYSGMISDDIGYVALTTFTREAGANVGKALRELKEENENLKGVVLDLRGNGGGLLIEAVNVSNVFIPNNKLVVSTKGKIQERDRSFMTRNQPVDGEIPLVVLINKRSASASEIVSGVIQDYDRGVLLGQRSYGKGLVQNTKDIGYNSKLKLTTSKYYIPSGRCIQSVRYEDGEPVDIPEEERAVFKTINGREVRDGGGVKPDIYLPAATELEIVNYLDKEHILFDYATQYALENESIPEPMDFNFDGFDDFLAYMDARDFDFRTATEKELEKMIKSAEKDGMNDVLQDEFEQIRREIREEKKNEIKAHREIIEDLLEKEIIGRYYFEKGRIKTGLKNDKEISEAISLINDPSRYEAILKGE